MKNDFKHLRDFQEISFNSSILSIIGMGQKVKTKRAKDLFTNTI